MTYTLSLQMEQGRMRDKMDVMKRVHCEINFANFTTRFRRLIAITIVAPVEFPCVEKVPSN